MTVKPEPAPKAFKAKRCKCAAPLPIEDRDEESGDILVTCLYCGKPTKRKRAK